MFNQFNLNFKNLKLVNKFLLSILLITLVACSKYTKLINNGSEKDRYDMAGELYLEGQYQKSLTLYELVVHNFNGKPEKETILYRMAEANFQIKDYVNAVYYYEKLINEYPKSSKLEEAQYNKAMSHYYISPKYSIDQKDTHIAIQAFQDFIDNHPESPKVYLANQKIKELNHKLETKAFEIAKQYYHIGNFESAIVAFDNMLSNYLGTDFREQILYYKFKSGYELAMNSIAQKKSLRIENALKMYDKFVKSFPNSTYTKEVKSLQEKILKEKELIS